ncbi:VWA domain-containing protein [Paraliomyxa miuraensis]|uniref:VWA domain-containing protein n=1 Tax=Paraliomyxa miuraensis TaxID=376150 RepID=UPI00224CD9A6|nr:VWA domain-containing protein [Paraliomyxa miuraensis]MCX4247819.1 VWA domain-containing protein [Paraliomyxa miuraensis]
MRGPSSWRRGVLLGAWVGWLGVAGCNAEHPIEGVDDGLCVGEPSASEAVGLVTGLDVDVLLVIDDSGSMLEEQATLAASFGSLIDVLERPEVAGSYRIAVTTTSSAGCNPAALDVGELRLTSCRSRPEAFVSDGSEGPVADVRGEACEAICPESWASWQTLPTTTQYDDVPRPRPWIERIGARTNLPEGLTPQQALQCIGPQGIAGCRFESPLEAMRRAVLRTYEEGDPNFGFIREHAVLLVVFITDEVDCSFGSSWASVLSPDGDRVFWSDPDAPGPTSAVCWNAGVACDEGDPLQCHAVDLDAAGAPVDPADADEHAVLRPVSGYVELLEALGASKQAIFPNRGVVVTLLGGANGDGSVTYAETSVDPVFGEEFGIGPGCQNSSGKAVPPVRLRELVDVLQVGDGRTTFSICDADYTRVLDPIAESLAHQPRPACMPGCVADIDPSTPDQLDPSCELVQDVPDLDAFANYEDQSIVRCSDDGTLPVGQDVCYTTLTGDERSEYCIDQGNNLQFQLLRRPGVYVPSGTQIRASCVMSECTATECPDLR